MNRAKGFGRVASPGIYIFFLSFLLHTPQNALAQGFIINELGVRWNSMGAAIGRVDEVSAIYHNPASLTMLSGTQLEISTGFAFLDINFRMAPWEGSQKYLTEPVDSEGYFPELNPNIFAVIPMIGASTNLWSDKLVGAVAVYVPNAAGASFDEKGVNRYHIINAFLVSAFTTAAVAYKPWPWLSVGLGGSAVFIKIHRRSLLYPEINGNNYSALIGSETQMEIEGFDVKPAFHFGLQVWPHRTLSLGFMMLSRYDVSLEGPLTFQGGEKAPPLTKDPAFTQNEQRTEVISPWIIGFGANWDITQRIEFGAELRYYFNSQVQEQKTIITSGEILPSLLPDGLVTPKNNKDTISLGGGFKVTPPLRFKVDLMTGIHYGPSPSPDNTVEAGAPSFDIIAYHLGVRWHINDLFRLSLIYGHYWYLERSTHESITSPPTNFIGSGQNNQFTLVFESRLAKGLGGY